MNLQSKMILFLVLCISFTLLATELQASSGITAVQTAANVVKGYVNNTRSISRAIGGIVGCFGAIKIYNQWALGERKIVRPILAWGGAMLFLHIVPTFIMALFYGTSMAGDVRDPFE